GLAVVAASVAAAPVASDGPAGRPAPHTRTYEDSGAGAAAAGLAVGSPPCSSPAARGSDRGRNCDAVGPNFSRPCGYSTGSGARPLCARAGSGYVAMPTGRRTVDHERTARRSPADRPSEARSDLAVSETAPAGRDAGNTGSAA